MMFQLHTAFATELIALAAAIALLVWVSQKEIKCAAVKIGGYFILVTVLLSMLCTLYYGIRYWKDGYFRTPHGSRLMMETGGMGGMEMMQGKKCPMMEEMMGGPDSKEKEAETQPSKEGHEAHHPK